MNIRYLNRLLCAWTPALTLAFACFGPLNEAQASSELFPSTEVTARYDPYGWAKRYLSEKLSRGEHVAIVVHTFDVSAADVAALEAIEPASGGGGAKAEGHGEAKAEGGHGGGGGGKKPAEPAFPTVTIGGKLVVTHASNVVKELQETVPGSLKEGVFPAMLNRRFSITPYSHNPKKGPADAKITVVEFIDLSCGQCMPELAKIDTALTDYVSMTQVVSVHAPTARFQDTNLPAFYGKIAARGGTFWSYRSHLIQDKTLDTNAVFDELVKSGMDVRDVRSLMLTDARRFYRELDADALLARSFGVTRPPVLFVNGIRVGDGGIPLDKLPDVLTFVNERIKRGLTEPPQ